MGYSEEKTKRATQALEALRMALTSNHGDGGRNHMIKVEYTAQQISQAIACLNQKRKPLLKIMNAPGFTMNTAGKWAISAELCGLNTATRRLEEARARYVTA